jgi:hypothetical protein
MRKKNIYILALKEHFDENSENKGEKEEERNKDNA